MKAVFKSLIDVRLDYKLRFTAGLIFALLCVGSALANAGPIPEGRYIIISRHSGMAMDIQGISAEDGANVYQWGTHRRANQQFDLDDVGGGFYTITSVNSGKALDIAEASRDNGGNLQQWSRHGNGNQQFRLEAADANHYGIIARHSNKALDLAGFSREAGGNIHQWSWNSQTNQQWRFERVSGAPTPTEPPPPTAWKTCAQEGERCSFQGRSQVRYGANDVFTTRSANGGIDCTNQVFGDPVPGVRKSCEVPSGTVVGGGPAIGDWHNPATWGGQVPAANASVTIDRGKTVYLDRAVTVRNLTINGTLRCRNSDLALNADWIMVHGTFECGTQARPYERRMVITLRGPVNAPDVMNMGSKVLGVMNGGVLSLHGEEDREAWVRLNSNARRGDRDITLDRTVSWRPGDTIFIATSTEDPEQAERKRITNVNGRIVTLDSPLAFPHFGQRQTYDNGKGRSWTVETRAEVGLLSRNIVIRGDDASVNSRFGGHVMVMKDSKAFIDGVSFDNMGQEGVLGRYPFHWHFVGDGSGQYIRNSSIYNSFNRCVTVHQTDNTRVENNVCFKHIGHGYFLEDGVEQNNIITGNLGAGSITPREGKHILASDIMRKEGAAGPATFWISNPKNIINNNVAAGGEGTGFWYATENDSKRRYDGTTTKPSEDTYQQFHNNLTHSSPFGYSSCVNGGGVHGWESQNIVVRNLTAYMTTQTGNWPCSLRNQRFENMVLIDSGRQGNRAAFTAPNHMTIVDSLFVANSALASLNGGKKGRAAFGHYDQGTSITNTHFAGYTAQDNSTLIGFAGGAVKNSNNRMNNVTFSPAKFLAYPNYSQTSGQPTHLFTSFHDDNQGSMTGVRNSVLMVKHPLFAGLSECRDNAPRVESNALVCTMRQIRARTMNLNAAQANQFVMFRYDASGQIKRHNFSQLAQFMFIQGFAIPNKNFHYGVEFKNKPSKNYNVLLQQGNPGDKVIYEYRNVRSGDRVVGFRQVSSLSALRSANDEVYYKQGDRLIFKAILQGSSAWNASRNVQIRNN